MKNSAFLNAYFNIINEDQNSRLDELINEYSSKKEILVSDIVNLLNIAVCDELLAAFNYKVSYNLSKTDGKADFDPEFEQHEDEENEHADKLIERIKEINEGDPLLIPWNQYPIQNSVGTSWKQESSNDSCLILSNRYLEELNAIKFYKFVLNCVHKLNEKDPVTERLLKSIIEDEERHELDLRELLIQYKIDYTKIK